MNDIILLPNDKWNFHSTGLNIQPGLEYREWKELGIMLQILASIIEFAIGDWLAYGEHVYGEMYSQAIIATGKSYQTLANYVWVARAIDPSRRREIDFGHHSAVAGLEPDAQDAILAQAQEEDWRVWQTRAYVRGYKHKANGGNDNQQPIRYCPTCGREWSG